MKNKPVDPRTRWVFHVCGILTVGDQQEAFDKCFVVNYRLDHEARIELLRMSVIGSLDIRARAQNGVAIVGATPEVTFMFTSLPTLVRVYLDEAAPPAPRLVQ